MNTLIKALERGDGPEAAMASITFRKVGSFVNAHSICIPSMVEDLLCIGLKFIGKIHRYFPCFTFKNACLQDI